MKRKFTFLAAALALFAFLAIPLGMRGQTRAEVVAYTLDGTEVVGTNSAPYNNYATASPVTQDGISWEVYANTTMNPWRIGGKSLSGVDRLVYSTVPIADNITKIEVTHGTASNITVNSWTVIVASDADFNNVVSTLTPTFTANATTTINRPTGADWTGCYYKFIYNVTVTQTSNKFLQFVSAEFYKQEGSGPVIATPTFNPVGGDYTTTQNVTISCETQGATIYYTTDGSTPDNTSTQYTAAIPVSSTTTIKAVAYVGTDASSVATATYNIVQPLTTMQAIYDKATEVGNTATYAYITLGDWVVSGVSTNGKNVFVTDGTKGFVIFDNGGSMGFAAGDILSGTVYCKVQLYNGFAELTLLNTSTSGLSVAHGGTVTAANIAMADLTGVNTGALVHYDNLTCSVDNTSNTPKYYLSDGTTTLQVYNSIYAFGSTLVADHNYNITGVYQQYTTTSANTKEILPRSADDIEEVGGTVTIATPTFSPAAGTYTEAQSVTISCETPNVTIYYTTNGNDPDDESTLYEGPITVGESMTIKAIAYDANDNTSAIGTAEYVINLPVPAQTFNLIDGHNPVEGETYLIVDLNSGKALTSANGSSSSPVAVEVTIEDNQIITDNVALQWTFEATEGGYIIHPLGSNTTWLYSTNVNNGVRVGTNEANVWTLDITDEGSNYHGFQHNGTSRYMGVYQSTDWRAYTTIHANIKETQIALFVLGDAPAPAPSITAANVNIAYDVTGGEIEYTINNMVESGVLTAATESEWLDLGEVDVTVPFYCDPNTETTPRAATVTLTYTYNRETVTKDVTVTQAAAPVTVVYTTIPELFAAATGTATEVLVTFDSWVVSGVSTNGKNVFVTDNEGHGFVIFNNGGGLGEIYSVGDVLTGTEVSCSLVLYHGFAELTGVNAEDLTIVAGGTVTETNIAMAELAGVNTGALVSYDGLTCSVNGNNYYLTDGTTTIQVYTALYAFEALEDGKVYNITGIYQQYNTTKEVLPRSAADIEEVVSTEPTVTITDDTVNVPAEGGNGTITVTYENIEVGDIDPEVLFFAADGTTSATYDWITVTFNEENNAVYTVEANDGEARTAYFKVNEQSYSVLSNLVTVNQAAYVAPPTPGNWVLTTLADLTADDIFVIVGTRTDETYAGDYAMTNDNGTSAPSAVSVTVVDGTLAAEPADNLKWNLEITDDGYVFYPNGDTENWLYCINTNNGVKVGTGEAKHYTLSENGYLTTTETTIQRYLGVYLAQDWRCYNTEGGNIANQTFAFYKRVDAAGTPLFISGYNGSAYANGGYHLIATPVDGIDPANVTNMTNGNYDLYMFDQSGDDEWVNYRQGNNQFAFTELVAGMGYLYAHDTDITLYFEGDLIEGDSYDVSLVLDTDSEFPGWNLVGNSFTVPASIGDRDYYEMHENGRDLIQTSGAIDPMQGIFVIAETDEEELTFSKTITTGGSKVVMNVTSDRSSLVDRATIRFGEGRQLRKIQLNPDNTKIYITEGNTDYAVVRSSDEAEIPVSFKTAENGTYTINFSTEEVEMEYMHLIDNMTGADVDLLATPSYTFEARTTDYASRFRLVFATTTGVSENSENNFAFYNGGNWVINNMGDATLQVVDMLGHILSSETINGNASISIDQVPGVYMIRLVSGNDVKVQKVIIK